MKKLTTYLLIMFMTISNFTMPIKAEEYSKTEKEERQ